MAFEIADYHNMAALGRALAKDNAAPFIDSDDGRHFTYASFWKLAGQLARSLAALGALPGDRIAVQVEKSVEAIALFWACVRGGFVLLPLNTAYTPREVSYFLADAAPRILICAPNNLPALKDVASAAGCTSVVTHDDTGKGTLIEAVPDHDHYEDVVNNWDDLAAILYTSGTTGRSKGAMLSQRNLASNAAALVKTWQFTRDDVLIHALPVYHTHGLFTAVNTVFLSGGRILYQRKFDADNVMRAMPGATCFMGVPTFYTRLLASEGLTRDATSHMRLFVSGSAPLLAETHKAFRERTGHAILERYGMTETSMNTSNPLVGERRAGTVGFALPGVDVRVKDKTVGDDGMIEVRGPNVFAGYWNNPERTKEDFAADGFFITGDIGRFDGDGYLTITGRAKDLIITGGFNVYPKEIELLLDDQPGVLESAVIGVPHADFGEAVLAVVVVHPGQSVSVTDLVTHLKQSLAAYKVPKRVIVVDELPRNAMGKVQKAVLRDQYKSTFWVKRQ